MSDTNVYGLDIAELPDGFMPVDMICVVKGLDSDGDMSLVARYTDGLEPWDRVGLLDTALDMAKCAVRDGYTSSGAYDEDDEDED